MRPLRHGYTNQTVGDGAVVAKTYEGPDAALRLERERTLLTRLRGRLPVPPIHAADAGTLTLGFLPGTPGQELLDAGHAPAVLAACGRLLRRVHDTPTGGLALGPSDPGVVLVHGDFGPNNVLVDPESWEVTALVDWEFAHLGRPIEDLAWCEWLVRTHHPARVPALDHFFDAYGGDVPPWPDRQAEMLARCEALERFCHRWEPEGPGVRLWRERTATTASWR
ncbi:aminoglycoside phosphotransferase [Streptomyces sp. 8K308]|nr:aminoglycoside phosphotransferase [Streptomyces sp. 8K308]